MSSPELEVQELLREATALLYKASQIIEENNLGEQTFMGLVFEPHFGWFSLDGELREASDWNNSECVIGSKYAWCYGMEGWKERGMDPEIVDMLDRRGGND